MLIRSVNTSNTRRTRLPLGVGLCVFAIMVLGYAPIAKAAYFQFDTTTTILNGFMPAGSIVAGNNSDLVTITTPGASVMTITGQESNSPGDNYDGTGAGSDIVFANIGVAPITNATPFEVIEIPYVFHVVITDYAGPLDVGAIGSVSFDIEGILTGTIGAGKKVNLSTNTYDAGNILTKQIGNDIYTLDLNFYVPPGPSHQGAFGVHVEAVPVPEPGTLALLGLGLIGLATPAIRRLRRKARR